MLKHSIVEDISDRKSFEVKSKAVYPNGHLTDHFCAIPYRPRSDTASFGSWTQLENFLVPLVISSASDLPRSQPLEYSDSSSYIGHCVLVILFRILTFLIRSHREMPTIARSVSITLNFLKRPIVRGKVSVP